ncbi:MAG: hypothetical protein ACP5HU_00935 [Phycisphaerae bacterium]
MTAKRDRKTDDGYWPEDLVDESIVPPGRILSEAAEELSHRTGGVLTAEPVQIGEPQSGELIYAFYLVADALRGFRYELFRVLVPAQMYPLEIRGGILDTSFQPGDEQAFRRKLQDLFGSDKVRKVVSALVAESRQQSD